MDNIIQKEWVIMADLDQVNQICLEMAGWMEELGIKEHIFPVQILAREALNNAVIHGNNKDQYKKISCNLSLDSDDIRIKVSDEGTGFNWRKVIESGPTPTSNESGRGLWMYHLYADIIRFNAIGNQVELIRHLTRQ